VLLLGFLLIPVELASGMDGTFSHCRLLVFAAWSRAPGSSVT
jgi:hypothetical protein